MLTAVFTPEQLERQAESGRRNPGRNGNYFGYDRVKTRLTDKLTIQDPLGERKTLNGVFVLEDPTLIKTRSGEYIAIEVTPNCNVACHTCFNESNRRHIRSEDIQYMGLGFASELAQLLGDNPFARRTRNICVSGGEPTLDIDKLVTITDYLTALGGRNYVEVATNATVFPIDEMELEETLRGFDKRVNWQLSFNNPLRAQYKLHRGEQSHYYQIPDRDDPLLYKIGLVKMVAQEIGINVTIRVGGLTHEINDTYAYVVANLGEKEPHFRVYKSAVCAIGSAKGIEGAYERSDELCSSHEELYVCADGTMYPSMHWVGTDLQLGKVCRIDKVA